MTRKFTFAFALVAATAMGSFAAADQPGGSGSPFRTADYSQSNEAQIVEVRNGRQSYRGGYYYGNRYGNRGYYNNYYSPNRYGYRNYNYGYRSNPYYGNRNYYGRSYYGGRSGVSMGNFGVWW